MQPPRIQTLADTVEYMLSSDYKDRMKAEFYQVYFRERALREMLRKYFAHELDFKPTCHISDLQVQLGFMGQYLNVLKRRAEIEGVDLDLKHNLGVMDVAI